MKYTNNVLRKVHALLDDYMIYLLNKGCAKINFKFLDRKGKKFVKIFKRKSNNFINWSSESKCVSSIPELQMPISEYY